MKTPQDLITTAKAIQTMMAKVDAAMPLEKLAIAETASRLSAGLLLDLATESARQRAELDMLIGARGQQ